MGRELSVDKRGTSDRVSNKRKKDETLQSSSHTYLKGVWGAESHPIMALQRCLLLLPYKRRGGTNCVSTQDDSLIRAEVEGKRTRSTTVT